MCVRFRDYMRKYRIFLVFALACSVLSAFLLALVPQYLGNVTTEIFEGILAKLNGTGAMNLEVISGILKSLAVFSLLSAILCAAAGWIMEGISADLTVRLRESALQKLHSLPLSYFEKHPVGELQSCALSDAELVGKSIGQGLFWFVTGISSLIWIAVMMLRIHIVLALVTMALLAVSFIVTCLVSGKMESSMREQLEAGSAAKGYLEEMYSGRGTLQIFGRGQAVCEMYEAYNERLREASRRAELGISLMSVFTQSVSMAGYVLVILFGGLSALKGNLAVGEIQAFVHYICSTEKPERESVQALQLLRRARVSWTRVKELLETEAESTAEPETQEDTGTSGSDRKEKAADRGVLCQSESHAGRAGEVRFENVTFAYESGEPVLRDFSAVIAPGTHVAITGCTGAGKTTIVKLLMRFYDVQEGTIYIDGKDIREYDRSALREKFGMVLQEVWLFHGSILENIRYGNPETSKEEAVRAAQSAGADAFIRLLPEGYETVVGEGGYQLSDGQKQLLTIARAILGKPEILILDEATSSVDTMTEQKIQKALTAVMEERTCFVIAHRPGTIRDAQQVIHLGNDG